MQLSDLQKFILKRTYRGELCRVSREEFKEFYSGKSRAPKEEEQVNVITRSIERLIDRELLIGYGRRTRHKWFIEEVKLTAMGMKEGRMLLSQQQKLPFKKLKNI